MWPFDNYKKTKEFKKQEGLILQEKERLQKLEQERIAQERERRMEMRRRKLRERQTNINDDTPSKFY